jgi:hypothetical protein
MGYQKTLVKSTPKKSFSKKTSLSIESLPKKLGFLGKNFFKRAFYKGHMYIFEISMGQLGSFVCK